VIKKHLVAVPYWISDRLSALSTTDAQAGLSLLLDYSKMRKFFSLEDLASLLRKTLFSIMIKIST
jgi:hypothetical protein